MPLTAPNPEGRSFLPALRGSLLRDAFTSFREGQQFREMRGLPSNYAKVGFNRSSDLQAYPST